MIRRVAANFRALEMLDDLSISSMATTPEEFKAMMAKEYEDYGKLIKELGISTN